MTELELDALEAAIRAGHDELTALCKGEYRSGGKRFRMRIPVDDEDSDVVLGRGLSAGDALLAELRLLRAHQCALPESITQALNSGDGTYRP